MTDIVERFAQMQEKGKWSVSVGGSPTGTTDNPIQWLRDHFPGSVNNPSFEYIKRGEDDYYFGNKENPYGLHIWFTKVVEQDHSNDRLR